MNKVQLGATEWPCRFVARASTLFHIVDVFVSDFIFIILFLFFFPIFKQHYYRVALIAEIVRLRTTDALIY